MQSRFGLLKAAALSLAATQAVADPVLVMVEQPGCVYCERWNESIGPIYPNTPEGMFAPLVRAQLREPPPDGIKYTRRVTYTPTFVLAENGRELARIEGYPGEDFFWGLLGMMLETHTDYGVNTSELAQTN
jgi:hypothetical protein